MRGLGPSFGSRARAAELNAATSARARSSDLVDIANAQRMSAGRAGSAPPFGKPEATTPPQLSAEAPQYTPIENLHPRRGRGGLVGGHSAPRVFAPSNNSSPRRGHHPLRHVTTVHPPNANVPFEVVQHVYQPYGMFIHHGPFMNAPVTFGELTFNPHRQQLPYPPPAAQLPATPVPPAPSGSSVPVGPTVPSGPLRPASMPRPLYKRPSAAIAIVRSKPIARVYGPDDISPTKMEEKTAQRSADFKALAVHLFGSDAGDPFLSPSSGGSVNSDNEDDEDDEDDEPYRIDIPPLPLLKYDEEFHATEFVLRTAQNPPISPPSVARTEGVSSGYEFSRPESRGPLQPSFSGTPQRHRLQTPSVKGEIPGSHYGRLPHPLSHGALAAPSRGNGALAARTEWGDGIGLTQLHEHQQFIESSRCPVDDTPASRVPHPDDLTSSSAPRAMRFGGSEMYTTPPRRSVDSRQQSPFPGSIVENSLLRSSYLCPIQPPHWLASSVAYPAVGCPPRYHPDFEPEDAYSHLPPSERPVPWRVVPFALEIERQSIRIPPPGLPFPDPRNNNAFHPSEGHPESTSADSESRRSSEDRQGEAALRRQIARISLADAKRRLHLGLGEEQARKAAEVTNLVGNTIVNLQSYVVGRRDFAPFGDVLEYMCDRSRRGPPSYFDNDPKSDTWILPPLFEDQEAYAQRHQGYDV